MNDIHPDIADEIDNMVNSGFDASDWFWRNYIYWVGRGMPGMLQEDLQDYISQHGHMPKSEQVVAELRGDDDDL